MPGSRGVRDPAAVAAIFAEIDRIGAGSVFPPKTPVDDRPVEPDDRAYWESPD